MINDTFITNKIDEELLRLYQEGDKLHEPSGRLTASTLYQPLRFQIMKSIGVPRKTPDVYALGKFKRGNDVEAWYVSHLETMGVLVEKQKRLEYRGALGFADTVIDSDKMLFRQGLIPHEIKSVVNSKLKWITKAGEPDYHYQLQACFYAMAMKVPYYAVDIISAEDLRRENFTFETKKLRADVDEIITRYEGALNVWEQAHELPVFEPNPKVTWTSNFEYAPFPLEWIEMDDKTLIKNLEELKNKPEVEDTV